MCLCSIFKIKPVGEAIPTNTRYDHRHQIKFRLSKLDAFARTLGLNAYTNQRFITWSVIWQRRATFFEDSAEDFTKTSALILYTCLRRGYKYKRWGIFHVRRKRLG